MFYELDNQRPTHVPEGVFVAPSADIIGDVELLPDSSIWFNAVLRGDIERISIGRGSNVQDGTVCHTDANNPCVVGDFVTVGHMAMLHGCRIGSGSLIGIGATLLNGSVIGENCIVGAHTLITEGKSFPDNCVIMGAPGKVVRDITADDLNALRGNADRYIKRAGRYLRHMQLSNGPAT